MIRNIIVFLLSTSALCQEARDEDLTWIKRLSETRSAESKLEAIKLKLATDKSYKPYVKPEVDTIFLDRPFNFDMPCETMFMLRRKDRYQFLINHPAAVEQLNLNTISSIDIYDPDVSKEIFGRRGRCGTVIITVNPKFNGFKGGKFPRSIRKKMKK